MRANLFNRIRAHLPAVALFAVLSLAWSFPLVLHLGTHVPGGGAGDNVSFVWNLWWMRTAVHQHLNPFYTTFIFHPVGVDLTQHTHTALSGVIAATLLPLSAVAAQNVLLLVSLFLNAFAAYLLAHHVTGNRFAARAAGIAFGEAAPILVRLGGHFERILRHVGLPTEVPAPRHRSERPERSRRAHRSSSPALSTRTRAEAPSTRARDRRALQAWRTFLDRSPEAAIISPEPEAWGSTDTLRYRLSPKRGGGVPARRHPRGGREGPNTAIVTVVKQPGAPRGGW
jgi:hypothetical protein